MAIFTGEKTSTSDIQLELTIEGLLCSGCTSRLTVALELWVGILEVIIDHKAGRGRIDYDPASMNAEQIRATINRLGFSVVQNSQIKKED